MKLPIIIIIIIRVKKTILTDSIADTTVGIGNLRNLDTATGVLGEDHRLEPRRGGRRRVCGVRAVVTSRADGKRSTGEPSNVGNGDGGVLARVGGKAQTLRAVVERAGLLVDHVGRVTGAVPVGGGLHESVNVTVARGLGNLESLAGPDNDHTGFGTLREGHIKGIELRRRVGTDVDQQVLGGCSAIVGIINGFRNRHTSVVTGVRSTVEGERHDGVETGALVELELVKRITPEDPEGAVGHVIASVDTAKERQKKESMIVCVCARACMCMVSLLPGNATTTTAATNLAATTLTRPS